MDFLDEPAVVLLAVAAAALLALVEVALPTVGLAGTAALLCGALAAWGISEQEADWWPLTGVVGAVVLWGALIAMRRMHPVALGVAVVLFAGGSLGFAALADDGPAAGTAAVTTVAMAVAFPFIFRSADRLASMPAQVGREAFIGRTADVVDWDGERGRVRVEGSLWNADGPAGLAAGERVTVESVSGMTVRVVRSAT